MKATWLDSPRDADRAGEATGKQEVAATARAALETRAGEAASRAR